MAVYFASDVHLRHDRPERGQRFARWVERLGPDDCLTIVGDLCDFWYAARQIESDPMACPALRGLVAFRQRGGDLTIMTGNHDTWLGPYYEAILGARLVGEPLDVAAYGLRFRLVHGHRLGGRRLWKQGLESRAFLQAFRHCPGPLARGLDRLLSESNARARDTDDRRHLGVFREYAARCRSNCDIVVIGHIHRPRDESDVHPRLVVLGGWHHQASYLKVDPTGASLVIEPDPVAVSCDSARAP